MGIWGSNQLSKYLAKGLKHIQLKIMSEIESTEIVGNLNLV